jgi:nuclear transport factor 2 (NTF2) superfamily protein
MATPTTPAQPPFPPFRSEFSNRRNEIIAFLSRKWTKALDYRLPYASLTSGTIT